MWRVRRPAGGPVTGTGSLRGSSFRLPCKRTTASSRLTSLRPPLVPLARSFSFFLPFLPPSPLSSFYLASSLSIFHLCLPTLLSPLSRSDPVRAFALAPLSSPLVRPTDRPAGLPLLSSSPSSTASPLLFRTKALPHARNDPPAASSFLAASLRRAAPRCDALFSLAPFYRSRSAAAISFCLPPSLFPSHLAKQRSRRVFASSFFLFLPLPRLPRRRRLVPFFFFVPCSSFNDRAGDTYGLDTQLFIPRDDVGSPRVGRTAPERR